MDAIARGSNEVTGAIRKVIVVGAGPVGLAAANALVARGIAPVVLEARPPSERRDDPRALALSYGTRLILERLGAWSYVDPAHAIHAVHVSQRGRLGRAHLTDADAGLPALGYVVGYTSLTSALQRRLAERGVAPLTGARVVGVRGHATRVEVDIDRDGSRETVEAEIVVQADGLVPGHAARALERDYGQWAIVADVRCERTRPGEAYERFTAEGPIALLPRGDRHALVWTVAAAEAPALLALTPDELGLRLGERFGGHVGRFTLAGPAQGFPLALRFAREIAAERVVLVGNAAQTLHPVAAQGFNLGLRDAYELARTLAGATDAARALADYRRRRRLDRSGGTLLTDLLVRVFEARLPGLAAARGIALAALDAFPPAKRFLMRRMIFGARG